MFMMSQRGDSIFLTHHLLTSLLRASVALNLLAKMLSKPLFTPKDGLAVHAYSALPWNK